MAVVTVRYFAGARAAAGTDSEKVVADTVGALRNELIAAHAALERVLPACTLLVDGAVCRDDRAALTHGCVVDVLPPFAGG